MGASNRMDTKQYMSDLIGDDFRSWHNCKIILSGGTGTGKTQFVLWKLIPYYEGKKILYLTNRDHLKKQLEKYLSRFKNVTLMNYQKLQANIQRGVIMQTYDLVIADECHFFLSDSVFNNMTDLSYDYVINQTDNAVVILMSATADEMFKSLLDSGIVQKDNAYFIAKEYDYVEKLFIYEKRMLPDIIDDILAKSDNEKILVFVNSIDRLKTMYSIYGDSADYLCSVSNALPFVNQDAIKNNMFAKRILFTTKALDNGVDIKDDDLRHIISEVFDVDSAIQCCGRKRPIDILDTCCLYFANYDKRAVRNFLTKCAEQLIPVKEFMSNKEQFLFKHPDCRELCRNNRIFYTDMADERLKINHMRLQKYIMDERMMNEMLETSYEEVLLKELGEELSGKKSTLAIECDARDIFLTYLQEIEGVKLFKEQQQELKDRFKSILGLHARKLGIATMNGNLKDYGYDYKITSHREYSRTSKFRDKTYWMIEKI